MPRIAGRPPGSVGRPPKVRPPSKEPVPVVVVPAVVAEPLPEPEGGGSSSGSDTTPHAKSSSSAAAHAYTAPQWLLQEKQTPKFFAVPIPCVSPSTLQAAQTHLGKTGFGLGRARKKSTGLVMDKIRQLQQDLKSSKQKIKLQNLKVHTANTKKEQGIQDIRKVRQDEIQEAMQELEQTLRAQHGKQYKVQEKQILKQVKEDYAKDYEIQRVKRKLEQEKQDEQEAQAPKKPKLQDQSKKSDQIQEQMDGLKTKMDKLTEKKSEMVWLLKSVIKADIKRKMALLKRKK